MVNNKINLNLTLKEKIIEYLIENKSPISINQLSKGLKTDYKNTFQTLHKISSRIINKTKIGNTNLIQINSIPNQEIFSVEEKRTQEFLEKNKQLNLIREDVNLLGYPFFIVLVFGSYVKETQTKKSDIDICIISDNKLKTKSLITKLNLLPLKIEIHDFTIKEFKSMLETKKDNLSKEIIKKNVILYGIENYYNLISNGVQN